MKAAASTLIVVEDTLQIQVHEKDAGQPLALGEASRDELQQWPSGSATVCCGAPWQSSEHMIHDGQVCQTEWKFGPQHQPSYMNCGKPVKTRGI